MPGQNTGDFDKIFSSVQRIYQSDGIQIKRADGSRPTALKFGPAFAVTFNVVTDMYEVNVSGSGYVEASLALTSSAPLTINGGYAADLSGPLTFAVLTDGTSIVVDGGDNLAVGVITNTQHGNRGGGSLHALAVPGGDAGFLSGSFATDLTNATATATTAGTLVKRGASGQVVGAWFQTAGAGSPAASGEVRLRAAETIRFRNNANTGDVTALSRTTASDVVHIGESGNVAVDLGPVPGTGTSLTDVYMNTSGPVWFYDGSDQRLKIHDDANGPVLEFSNDKGAIAMIRGAPAQDIYIEGSGTEIVVGTAGTEPLRVRQNEVVMGLNIALARVISGDPDTYQSGSGVVWIEAAGAVPTAAPTTGVYLYYDGTDLKAWKAGAGAPVTVV